MREFPRLITQDPGNGVVRGRTFAWGADLVTFQGVTGLPSDGRGITYS